MKLIPTMKLVATLMVLVKQSPEELHRTILLSTRSMVSTHNYLVLVGKINEQMSHEENLATFHWILVG